MRLASGASREVFRRASANAWVLVATPYVVEEVLRNLPDLPFAASGDWVRLRPELVVMDDVLTLESVHVVDGWAIVRLRLTGTPEGER